MSGTIEGGIKAAETNKIRYGEDFYIHIGQLGGRNSRGGGFAKNPELAKEAGRRGGLASRRGPNLNSHCIHGHEFTEDNTLWRTTATKRRVRLCKQCKQVAHERSNERKREMRLEDSLGSAGLL